MPESLSITLDGRPCVTPQTRRYTRRANSYWCPLGPASGRAWLLMLREDAEAIAAGGPYHRLAFTSQGSDGRRIALSFPALLFVKSTRLLPGAAGDANALQLVELADKRYLVERFSDTGNLQFNLRSYAQAAPYLVGTEGGTWSGVVTALWNTMSDVLGAFPGLPGDATIAGEPENLRFLGVNAWRALHHVLLHCGCTTAYYPLADRFDIVRLGAAQPGFPAGGESLFDAEPLEHEASRFPATIRVYFPVHYRNFGQERDTERDDNWSVSSALFSHDVPTNVAGAQAGTIVPLWDDLPRVLDENNLPVNNGALAARAEARASQWLDGMRVSGRRRLTVFAGLRGDVTPGPQVKAVLWRAWGPRGGTATEVVCHAGLPRKVRGGASALEGITWDALTPENESFAPLDLARRTFPAYPRLPNFVQVDDGESEPGALVEANESGVIPGVVVRYVAGAITTLEDCWIYPTALELCDTPDANERAQLRQGDCYYGRLSGITAAAGETRPLYVVEGERWAKRLTGGPEHSLLWQGPDGKLPQWHGSPTVKRSLQLGVDRNGFLQLGAATFVRQHNPTTGGAYNVVWPTGKPPGKNSYLYVNARTMAGANSQLEWSYQGCDFDGYGYFGAACGELACTYVTIRRGLLTNVAGLSVNPSAGDSGTVVLSTARESPFDPCDAGGEPDVVFVGGGAWSSISGESMAFVN